MDQEGPYQSLNFNLSLETNVLFPRGIFVTGDYSWKGGVAPPPPNSYKPLLVT